MALLILIGGAALTKLNTQFFPNFELDIITVRILWSGASAEDVESGITTPLEQELRNLDNLHRISSTSANGVAAITLEYEEDTNMEAALEKVNNIVSRTRQLPEDAEEPQISRVIRYERIARLVIASDNDISELRPIVYAAKDELLAAGIAKINISGLPKEELSIQVPTQQLLNLGLNLSTIADRIRNQSQDIPSGMVGRDDVARQLRALDQRRSVIDFENLPIEGNNNIGFIKLGDIAHIERRARPNQTRISYKGKPAVELVLFRDETADALQSAEKLTNWYKSAKQKLPNNVQLIIYDEQWKHIEERISLLLTNGGGGLVLVVGILLLFLQGRVAFWVTAGIPISFMAALAVLYATGGTINMISLFGLIMALGIIVDDAIVVGEDTLTHFEKGLSPIAAAHSGAKRMLAPVVSSSLTTIAAFLPLMLVGGIVGNIMFDIPLVIICVIIASLIECFLILPGHLRASFENGKRNRISATSTFRARFDALFDHFRDHQFRRSLHALIRFRWITLSITLGILIVVFGLIIGDRIKYTFFPSIEAPIIFASASFTAGSAPGLIENYLSEMEQALYETEKQYEKKLIFTAIVRKGGAFSANGKNQRNGDQHGSIMVELLSTEQHGVRPSEFAKAWRANINTPAGLESLTVSEARSGHPGRDLDIRLSGNEAPVLKAAALELISTLKTIEGVSAIEDDLPWGQEQFIFKLTPTGRSLGLNVQSIGRQLRNAFDGFLVQLFQDREDEIEVRVSLPDDERYKLSYLESMNIILDNGQYTPLATVVDISTRKGFDALRHVNGQLSVSINANLDSQLNENVMRKNLKHTLNLLTAQYGITADFQGRASDQRDTTNDMKTGAVVALVMIYIILAWVFASYSKPIIVMAAIPFGLIGAILGHWIMGIELTVLSLFGFFGLSGIVVNDSIILVSFYQELKKSGHQGDNAIVEAACQRLRAVLLTSLTTIAGLTPLLFETSLQAQFLIPMAVTICFGLAFSTLLVLFVIPILLSINEHSTLFKKKRRVLSSLSNPQ